MRAGVGQAEHLVREIVRRQGPHLARLEFLADLVILTEDAPEIAAGKEDGAGAACARDRRLFTVVQAGVGDLRSGRNPAKAGPAGQPIDAALTRATLATRQLICKPLIHNNGDHSTKGRTCRLRAESGKSLPVVQAVDMIESVEKIGCGRPR
jgi:hypothetical protein